MDKEWIEKFLKNWTNEQFLKERFKKIYDIERGYVPKQSLTERSDYRITFEEVVSYAEHDLEKKVLEFHSMAKYVLTEAIEYYLLAEQLISKMQIRQKRFSKLISVLPFGD